MSTSNAQRKTDKQAANQQQDGAQQPAAGSPRPPVQPTTAENSAANGQRAAVHELPRAPGRKRKCLRFLPEGFTEGTAPIGKPVANTLGGRKERPEVGVVFYKSVHRIGDSLNALPDGEKCARANKQLTVAEHIYAKEFSHDFGFDDPTTGAPITAHSHTPLPTHNCHNRKRRCCRHRCRSERGIRAQDGVHRDPVHAGSGVRRED